MEAVFDKRTRPQAMVVALCMALGYLGIYLCRKNISVVVPLLQDEWHVSKEQIGLISTAGTFAYMVGKFASGPVVDRIGGRAGYLLAMLGVALFGATGALATGVLSLALLHSASRLFGAGGWNAIMKVTSSWFPSRILGTAIAALSLSYVFGGVAGSVFAAGVLERYGGDWRPVIWVPSIVLGVLIVLCFALVRPGPLRGAPAGNGEQTAAETVPSLRETARGLLQMLKRPDYQALCILSFTLTLVREAIQFWGVDFLKTLETGGDAVQLAALKSTAFDLAGAIPILLMGALYDRLRPTYRRWVVFGILLALGTVLSLLMHTGKRDPNMGVILLGFAGLLLYGPYSILAGVISIQSGGTRLAGTATGFVDGIGYMAALLAGQSLGWVLDKGGYPVAFSLLATLTFGSAFAALRLRVES